MRSRGILEYPLIDWYTPSLYSQIKNDLYIVATDPQGNSATSQRVQVLWEGASCYNLGVAKLDIAEKKAYLRIDTDLLVCPPKEDYSYYIEALLTHGVLPPKPFGKRYNLNKDAFKDLNALNVALVLNEDDISSLSPNDVVTFSLTRVSTDNSWWSDVKSFFIGSDEEIVASVDYIVPANFQKIDPRHCQNGVCCGCPLNAGEIVQTGLDCLFPTEGRSCESQTCVVIDREGKSYRRTCARVSPGQSPPAPVPSSPVQSIEGSPPLSVPSLPAQPTTISETFKPCFEMRIAPSDTGANTQPYEQVSREYVLDGAFTFYLDNIDPNCRYNRWTFRVLTDKRPGRNGEVNIWKGDFDMDIADIASKMSRLSNNEQRTRYSYNWGKISYTRQRIYIDFRLNVGLDSIGDTLWVESRYRSKNTLKITPPLQ